MKTIREIITDLNVARSNNCSQEKSEEIKKIINDLLPYAELQENKTDGLETLRTIRHIHDLECEKDQAMDNAFDIIEKELMQDARCKKALEIIKNYCEVELDEENGRYFLNLECDYGYDMSVVYIEVTKEEYDFLKEIMVCH